MTREGEKQDIIKLGFHPSSDPIVLRFSQVFGCTSAILVDYWGTQPLEEPGEVQKKTVDKVDGTQIDGE